MHNASEKVSLTGITPSIINQADRKLVRSVVVLRMVLKLFIRPHTDHYFNLHDMSL